MQKLSLQELLSVPTEKEGQAAAGSAATQQFLAQPSQQVAELPLKKQLQLKRESTYRNTQQEMDKWIGIVKLTREKDTLNFVKNERDNAAQVGFFPSAPLNDFHAKLEGQLKSMEISSQGQVMKKEEAALEKLSPE